MLMFEQHPGFRRFVSFVVLMSFGPVSIDYWNFLPQVVLTRAVASEQPAAPAPDSTSGPASLSEDALKTVIGGPAEPGATGRILTAKLPTPDEMGKSIPKNAPADVSVSGTPLQVAAAIPVDLPAEAANALASADEKRAQGRFAEACAQYIDVMNASSRSASARAACEGFGQVVKAFKAGQVSEADMAGLTQYVSNPANLRSAEARWVAVLTTSARAQVLQARKDTAGFRAHTNKCIEIGLASLKQDLNNPLVGETLKEACNRAEAVGARDEFVTQLVETIHKTKPCIGSWVARFVVATGEGQRDRSASVLQYASMLEELPLGFVDEALNDPSVHPYVKATILHKVGMAHYAMRQNAEALAVFEKVVEQYPGSAPAEKAAYSAAYMKMRISPDDPMAGLNAFYDYLKQYPNAANSSAAWSQIAGIYFRANDLDATAEVARQIIQQFPDSSDARAAESVIAFIAQNLTGLTQEAKAPDATDPQILAGAMCGPNALCNLLKMKGIETSPDELASLAHTDTVGTTMLGLIQAARAKGFELKGVQAPEAAQLTPPFIAHVNENHFVVVTAVNEAQVAVVDGVNPEKALSPSEFSAMWQGKALVAADSKGGDPLREMELRGAKGGNSDDIPFDIADDCPNNGACDDCEDEEELAGVGPGPVSKVGISASAMVAVGGGAGLPTAVAPCPLSQTNLKGQGISVSIMSQSGSQVVREKDISLPVRGSLSLNFKRTYHNPWAWDRYHYSSTIAVYRNNVGRSWTHNFNMHVQASSASTPSKLVYYDEQGNPCFYTLYTTAGGYGEYRPDQPTSPYMAGSRLYRNTTDSKIHMTFPGGKRYQFSAPSADSSRYARLEAMDDTTYSAAAGSSQNRITLSYNGTGSAGRLTKVSAPSGDNRFLQLSYSGTFVTKVELKRDTTVLQQVQYAYLGDDITKVTDNDGKTIQHQYSSYPGLACSHYISRITDKAGVQTDFSVQYAVNAGTSETMGYIVTADYADGSRSVHDRLNIAGGINPATVTASKAGTNLRKAYYGPGWHNLLMNNIALYTDPNGTITKNWGLEYANNSDLTRVTRPDGETHIQYTYTPEHRVSTIVKPNGTQETWYYASGSLYPTRMTDAAGLDTSYTYDQNNHVITVNTPGGGNADWQYARNQYGLVTRITDPLGHATTKAYDARGQLTSSTDAIGNETKFEYDDLGNTTRTIDPRNKSTYFYYATGGCGCGGTGMLTKIKNALNHETQFRYDQAGNRTKVIDALNRETDFAYDIMNRVTRITQPSGSSIYTTIAYDALGQMTSQTGPDGRTKTFYYDHAGRQTQVADAVGSTYTTYTDLGSISTVTDGMSRTTDYDYDAWGSLTRVTYPNGKVTRYFYDAADRVTKTGAGSDGSIDPTERYYDTATGRLSKVRFTTGSTTQDAYYFYDSAAKLTKLTDWLDATNGLRYAYDDANRLTRITDYDNATLTYAYDSAGNVTSMTDYHGNTTSYTYTDQGQLSTLTAPGSRTWTYTYNALGQPSAVNLPNGMQTWYLYDTQNRLYGMDNFTSYTDMTHYSLAANWFYSFDGGGNITHVDQYEGEWQGDSGTAAITVKWDYAYDGRARLTSAVRKDGDESITASYAYTYDAGDNMLSKSEPFLEDFEDGDYTGWTASAGWSVTNGVMAETNSAATGFSRANADPNFDLRYSYSTTDTTATAYGAVRLRYVDANNVFYVNFRPSGAYLYKYEGGVYSVVASNTAATSAANTWYDVRVLCDGATCTVWRGTAGGSMEQVLSITNAPFTSTSSLQFSCGANASFAFDNIQVIGSSLANTGTTFGYNAGNELTSQTENGVTTALTYDAWGRMTNKTRGSYSATYAWGQGGKLTAVTSTFPGEGDVTYSYGGDSKRRERNDGIFTKYRWSEGWTVVSEEDNVGVLRLTLVGGLADIVGSNPSTGAIRYTLRDNLRSLRVLYSADKTPLGTNEYTPYGEDYLQTGATATRKFTGHEWDSDANLYHAPYRDYSADSARWLRRDPLAVKTGPNAYYYAANNPIKYRDPLGLDIIPPSPLPPHVPPDPSVTDCALQNAKCRALCALNNSLNCIAISKGEDMLKLACQIIYIDDPVAEKECEEAVERMVDRMNDRRRRENVSCYAACDLQLEKCVLGTLERRY